MSSDVSLHQLEMVHVEADLHVRMRYFVDHREGHGRGIEGHAALIGCGAKRLHYQYDAVFFGDVAALLQSGDDLGALRFPWDIRLVKADEDDRLRAAKLRRHFGASADFVQIKLLLIWLGEHRRTTRR